MQQTAQFLIKTLKSDKSVLRKIIRSCDGIRYHNNINIRPKFFLQISDHQQSMAARPLLRAFLIPPALLMVADYFSIPTLAGTPF
jgi:hypothetical protein